MEYKFDSCQIWGLRNKNTGGLHIDYNFKIPGAKNSNDNFMVVCFVDCGRRDAEIAADRHFGEMMPEWREHFDLVELKIEDSDTELTERLQDAFEEGWDKCAEYLKGENDEHGKI